MIWIVLLALFGVLLVLSVRIVAPTQAAVVERLGQYHRLWGPGLHVLVPGVDRLCSVPSLTRYGVIECRQTTLAFQFRPKSNLCWSGHYWFCIEDVAAAAYAPQPLLDHLQWSAQGQLCVLLTQGESPPISILLPQWHSRLSPIWAQWGVRLVRITLEHSGPVDHAKALSLQWPVSQ